MLFGEPTKKDAGLTLWGDFQDFENLYDTVWELAGVLGPEGFISDFVIGLCYDIRHASQGDRDVQEVIEPFGTTKYYGVKILWPYFLIQTGLLRWAAGYMATNAEHQANLYRLEHIIKTVLKKAPRDVEEEVLQWVKHFHGFSENYLFQFFSEVTYMYLFDKDIHRQRIYRLPKVLWMTDEISDEYRSFKKQLLEKATETGTDPKRINIDRDWPDFVW